MKKLVFILIFAITLVSLTAMDFTGNPKTWKFEDFVGADSIGDCTGKNGDISSLFVRKEPGLLNVRITFDDMCVRQNNKYVKDNYGDRNLQLSIKAVKLNDREIVVDRILSLSEKQLRTADYTMLRTPGNNMLEISIPSLSPAKSEEMEYTISVMDDSGTVVDQLYKSGATRDGGGNVAFVHHGNQGLTYTEVFYGQFPNETSGFDEILQVHDATGVSGNFHMSGTLMPAAQWHNPEFNSWLRTMASQGKAAMMTSALGQHIMPFVHDNMNNWSVRVESDMVRYLYNYDPKVAWVPERVWLDPSRYPNAGVIDWIGDNWQQNGVEAVVLDDWPHCNGYSNSKIHWMNNGSGINLRVIPINGDFVGRMMSDASGAKNLIWNTGMYGITVYGTDWEVAAEMNEHNGSWRLDNYESVLWWCHDNYPAVNGWKLDTALSNPNFNGQGIDITPGNYGLLGGTGGYGGSNNSWYTDWAATESHSDFHSPKWNYGYVWNDAYSNLMTAPNNSLSQMGWYIMMINLHETGWHDAGVSGWIHRYASHIKNANVYAEASRWAAGQYTSTTAAYYNDIDHDGGSELVMHNDKIFAVFEGIGGKVNWLFYKDGYGNAYSMVGSDVAYWSETDGDYNEGSANHFAALSDVSPNMQGSIYNISIQQSSGNLVQATLDQVGVKKVIKLETGKNFLDCSYNFFGATGYIKSGWTPDMLDIIWNGKNRLQRLYGASAAYAGWRNSSSGASVAFVLGSAGASHQGEFEGTMVKGDQISGLSSFAFRLFAGYTTSPSGTQVSELNTLAAQTTDLIGPSVSSASIVGTRKIQVVISEVVDQVSAETLSNYTLGSSLNVTAAKLYFGRKVVLTVDANITAGSTVTVQVNGVKDLFGNTTDTDLNTATASWVVMPHLVGTMNGWTTTNHTYDLVLQDNGTWQVSVPLGVGTHQYKIMESESWNGNDWPAANQVLTLTSAQTVIIRANCGVTIGAKSGDEYVTHFAPQVAGNFLSELGGIDWSTSDTRGVMNDSDNDGIWRLQVLVPAGSYLYKVALQKNWDQSTSGVNFGFTSDGVHETIFTYNMATNATASSSTGVFSPPTNLTAQIVGSLIRLNWNAPASRAITSYKIYRNNALLTTTPNATYDDAAVINGTRYAYALKTVYSSPTGESALTDSVVVSFFLPAELTAVQFQPSTLSSYTNFIQNGEIASHDNLRIEVKLTPNDSLNISTHSAQLHYTLDEITWSTKYFSYDHSADGASFWRLSLNNGVDFAPGQTVKFYITATDYNGPVLTDNNSAANYTVNIHQIGIQQQVAVTFRVNMNLVAHGDSIYLAGDFTNWDTNKILMTDEDLDGIYTTTVNFPIDTIYDHTYKYKSGSVWEFVGLPDRTFAISDSSPTQLLDLAYFNMNATSELQSVQFLPDSQSEFTNFENNASLAGNSYLYIEVQLSPADSLDNSQHHAQLVYRKGTDAWQTTDFAWNNNFAGNSYWRVTLRNGTDVLPGDEITFYVTGTDYNGPTYTDNNAGAYYHVSLRSATLIHPVTVTFSVDMRFVAHSDSIYLAGDFTDWGTNQIRMLDADLDGIYTASYEFPTGVDFTRQYKYVNGSVFEFNYGIHRIFLIDDTAYTQTLPVDFFNNVYPVELIGVQFMPLASSIYTNFNPGGSVANGSNLLFEVQLTPPDLLANSYYTTKLHYRVNNGTWLIKDLLWNNNFGNYSYWRLELINGVDIQNGDYVDFYVDATDYNGPGFSDNNNGNYYHVNVGDIISLQIPLNISITKTDTDIVLDWDAVTQANSYKIYAANSPDGAFTLLGTTSLPTYSIPVITAAPLKFYRVTASTDVISVKQN